MAQTVTISGQVKDRQANAAVPFVNVLIKNQKDSTFVAGTITDEGRYRLNGVTMGHYYL
ncbi:MAG: carboxypeptidase-like regulatory domain-containing protein [Cytophagales bacterium]